MRIALVNPIIQTVDRPKHFWSLFGLKPTHPLQSDREIQFVKLGKAIADLGHDVTLFVAKTFEPIERHQPTSSLRIRYLPVAAPFLFPPTYFPLLPTLSEEIKTGNFDVVQSSELFQPSTWIAAGTGKPVFVWEEMDRFFTRPPVYLLQKLYHQTAEKYLRRKVRVIPRSQSSKTFLEKRGWKNILNVIPTPVDTDLFKPIPGVEKKYLLVVSRLAPDKGLSFLLDVMVRVKKQKPEMKLVVVGNGSYREEFQREIREKKLTDQVEVKTKFHSHAELNEIYNECFMSLVTTEGGIYPFTASESMAAGKPVVSRFRRGLKDLIQNGKTGYLVGDENEMAQKITTLLEDREKCRHMGEEARKFICSYSDLHRVAHQFTTVYKMGLESRRKEK